MLTFQRCITFVFMVLRKFRLATSEGSISELYKKFEEDVLLLSVDAEGKDSTLAESLESLADFINEIVLIRAGQTFGRLDLDRNETDCILEAVTHAKAALERYDELGIQEPQRLVQIFRELVNRRNELDPTQAQDHPPFPHYSKSTSYSNNTLRFSMLGTLCDKRAVI